MSTVSRTADAVPPSRFCQVTFWLALNKCSTRCSARSENDRFGVCFAETAEIDRYHIRSLLLDKTVPLCQYSGAPEVAAPSIVEVFKIMSTHLKDISTTAGLDYGLSASILGKVRMLKHDYRLQSLKPLVGIDEYDIPMIQLSLWTSAGWTIVWHLSSSVSGCLLVTRLPTLLNCYRHM